MMGYYQNGWGWIVGLVMMALMFLFMAGFAVVIIYAIRGFSRGEARSPRRGSFEDPALAALRERYAHGEIDGEEYEERQRRLMRS